MSEQVEGGKSIAAFCRERGLRDWHFYEWKKRLRQADAASFVAVEVAASERPMRQALTTSSGIEIRLSRGRSVVVEPGFDASHLRRLLSVLEMES